MTIFSFLNIYKCITQGHKNKTNKQLPQQKQINKNHNGMWPSHPYSIFLILSIFKVLYLSNDYFTFLPWATGNCYCTLCLYELSILGTSYSRVIWYLSKTHLHCATHYNFIPVEGINIWSMYRQHFVYLFIHQWDVESF